MQIFRDCLGKSLELSHVEHSHVEEDGFALALQMDVCSILLFEHRIDPKTGSHFWVRCSSFNNLVDFL
jgi:hypothetical protein